jgi:hypothetical protein
MTSVPTPITANGRISLSYKTGPLPAHNVRFRCEISNPTGAGPYNLNLVGGGTLLWTTAVGYVDALIGALFNAATVWNDYTLDYYLAPNYIPLANVASAAVGTDATANQTATENTITYRDNDNKLIKLVLLECSFPAPQKVSVFSGGGLSAFVNDFANTTSGHIGSWFQGRDGEPPKRPLAITVTLSRKLRRAYGLA